MADKTEPEANHRADRAQSEQPQDLLAEEFGRTILAAGTRWPVDGDGARQAALGQVPHVEVAQVQTEGVY